MNHVRWGCAAVLVALGMGVLAGGAAARAAADDERDFKSLFDGKTLDGWKAVDPTYWSVEDGAITGKITQEHPLKENLYLVWQGGELADFELKLKSRLNGSPGINNGFQFRSKLLPNHDIAGLPGRQQPEHRLARASLRRARPRDAGVSRNQDRHRRERPKDDDRDSRRHRPGPLPAGGLARVPPDLRGPASDVESQRPAGGRGGRPRSEAAGLLGNPRPPTAQRPADHGPIQGHSSEGSQAALGRRRVTGRELCSRKRTRTRAKATRWPEWGQSREQRATDGSSSSVGCAKLMVVVGPALLDKPAVAPITPATPPNIL